MPKCPNCEAGISVIKKLSFNQLGLLRCGKCRERLGHSRSANLIAGLLVAITFMGIAAQLVVPNRGYALLIAVIALVSTVAQRYSARLYTVNKLGARKHV